MGLRAALFDLGGVLVRPSPNVIFSQMEEALALPRGFLNKAIAQGDVENPYLRLMRGEITFSQWVPLMEEDCRKLSAASGFCLPKQFSIQKIFEEVISKGKINYPMLQAAITLRNKGYKTCILTNSWLDDSPQRDTIAKLVCSLGKHFDFMIESCRIGMAKPDPEIYKYALEALKVAPHEAVFLDDIGANLKKAREVGMVTILAQDTDMALKELEKSTGMQAESEETKERLFESLLSECRDTIQAVREELKPDQKQRENSLDGESGKVSNLQYLHSYLTFIKLSTAIKRNESMAKGLQKALLQQQPEDDSKRSPRPQDLIRLYDIILQNLVELLQLPGLEEDKVFKKEIGLKTLVYKAYRCFFIAQSYVLVKKWSEALVLYDRVLKYASEVQSQAGTSQNSLKELPDVQELITQVKSEKYSLQAAAILDTNDPHETECPSQIKDNKPLVERFDTFYLDPSLVSKQANLVHFPPGFKPIPCKPLFFDLALNHVAFPPLEDKVEQKTKSGLTGYIKGIFGFRS